MATSVPLRTFVGKSVSENLTIGAVEAYVDKHEKS